MEKMKEIDLTYVLERTLFLDDSEWDFSNLYALSIQLLRPDESNILNYRALLDSHDAKNVINFFDNNREYFESKLPDFSRRFVNYRKGLDYTFYLEDFRLFQTTTAFSLIPIQLRPLLDVVEQFGNELGIDIVEEMEQKYLNELYCRLKLHYNDLEEWVINESGENGEQEYFFLKIYQLFNELPQESISRFEMPK